MDALPRNTANITQAAIYANRFRQWARSSEQKKILAHRAS